MDPAEYERLSEHFARLSDLPDDQREAELAIIEASEPAMAARLREWLRRTPSGESGESGDSGDSGDDSDLFEAAVQRGIAGAAAQAARAQQEDDGHSSQGSDPHRLSKGAQVGPYSIERRIDEGGFGDVYLASRSDGFDLEVALKIIKPGMDSRSVVRRFQQERQALVQMDHPSIARIFDGGTTSPELGSRPYFAMEFVDGPTITGFAATQGLDIRARIELFREVCAAVQHAHNKNVAHRDLKPSNILVSTRGPQPVPKVIDFGIAKALGQQLTAETLQTQVGQVMGTPAYMSPEQAAGKAVDNRTDVYALGLLLYELLTDTQAIDEQELKGLGTFEQLKHVCESRIERPSTRIMNVSSDLPTSHDRQNRARQLRNELDWIVMRCLEKEPELRYPTPDAISEDLRRFLEGESVEARPHSRTYQLRKFAKRNWKLVGAGAAVAAALLLAAVGLLVLSIWLYQAREDARTKELSAVESAAEARQFAQREEAERMRAERAVLSEQRAREQAEQREIEAERAREEEEKARAQAELDRERAIAAEQEAEEARGRAERALDELQASNAQLRQANDDLQESLRINDQQQEQIRSQLQSLTEAANRAEADAKEKQRLANDADAARDAAVRAAELARQRASEADRLRRSAEHIVAVLIGTPAIDEQDLARVAQDLASEHAMAASIYERLAERAWSRGGFEAAQDYQRQALTSLTRVSASTSAELADATSRLATILNDAGKPEQALRAVDGRVGFARNGLGESGASTVLLELARVDALLDLRRFDDANEDLQRLSRIVQHAFDPFDPIALAVVRRQADAMLRQGSYTRFGQVEELYRRVLNPSEASDLANREAAIAANNLAYFLRESVTDPATLQDQLKNAESFHQRSIAAATGVGGWGEDHWRTAVINANYGATLERLGRWADAAEVLGQSYSHLRRTLGADHPQSIGTARRLEGLYRGWHRVRPGQGHERTANEWGIRAAGV